MTHGHGGGRGQGRGRGRGRGIGRLSTRLLDPALIGLLSQQKEQHGYMLLEGLANLGLDDINPSVVYRSLRDMEERGWVTSEWEHEDTQGPPRRVYTLTTDGRSIAAHWQMNLQQVKQVIDRILTILNQS